MGNNQKLEKIDIRLLALEQEKADLLVQKKLLLDKLLSNETNNRSTNQKNYQHKLSTEQKVDLFAQLFQGRKGIHATRWENKQGKSGYSVACVNEWQAIICKKPKVKCGDCHNRLFSPLDNKAIYDHLSGKKTIGLYPLLSNDDCHLLAVDFDKADWQLDVSAFYEACLTWNIPFALERSRSGNGAHIWIFFDKLIPAKDARSFGFVLLDNAMENHAGLSFDSYDRFFPNQDNMPTGGFGNLIALPLQHGPRKSGNSEFVDKNFVSYPDQWSFLASLQRMKVEQVYKYLREIDSRKDGESELKQELKQDLKPWEKGLPSEKNIIIGCPSSITLVLANKIYIETKTLPQTILARLRRLASFSNPVFFKTQALRFSTNGIPRFICLANIEDGFLNLPRGCFDDIVKLLEQQSITIELEDKRKSGQRIKGIQFKGELRKDQKKAVSIMAKHDVGILHAPTAFGKTVTAIGLIYKRNVNTLILVHTRQLVEQWKERLSSFLTGVEIGVISGGKCKPTGQIDIATYQSMINRKDNSVKQYLFDYGQVIIDECHHISAPNYDNLLSEVHARYVAGITATPQRQDGHQPIIFMQAGPIRHTVKSDAREHFEQQVIVTQLDTIPPQEFLNCERSPNISGVYQWLMEDEKRNKRIIDDVVAEVAKNRHPIILTERREHAMILAELIADRKISFQVLRGAMKSKELKEAMDNINHSRVLIATGKYIGEGFDLAKLDTLFLALPISWKGSLAQYVGRIHRQFKGKERVIVYDYVDRALPMLQRMFKKRSKGYKAMGYTLSFKGDDSLIQAKLFQNT